MTATQTLPAELKGKTAAYWATIENYRWWLAHDQIYLQLIAHEKKISAETVRAIAKAYGINRNIKSDDDRQEDKTASAIADVLNGTAFDDFEKLDTLRKKFSEFRTILQRMPMNLDRGDKPTFVSGTSKLIWFFAPPGWTLFDRLAANGANIAKSLTSMERAERFYTALTERGFEQAVAKARLMFENSPFKALSAERLVDKYLWLGGCEDKAQNNARLMLHFFMNGLFPEVRTKLDILATDVAGKLQGDLIALTKK